MSFFVVRSLVTIYMLAFLLFILHLPRTIHFFFLMIRRPPRSTLDRSSAASDVYKRQSRPRSPRRPMRSRRRTSTAAAIPTRSAALPAPSPVSYTHLRAHETVLDLVCRLLLDKKNISIILISIQLTYITTIYVHSAPQSFTAPKII